MIHAILILSSCALAAAPGPGEAFKLNYRQAKVSVKFTFSNSITDHLPKISAFSAESGKLRELAKSPDIQFSGQWESDGDTEHVTIQKNDIHEINDVGFRVFPYESLFDNNKTFAFIWFERGRDSLIILQRRDMPSFSLYGPFSWWEIPFRSILDTELRGATVTRRTVNFEGRPLIVETHNKDLATNRLRVAIYYDASIGYLPRYIRGYTFDPKSAHNATNIKELYLISVHNRPAGGFVPEEWIDTSYRVDNFNPLASGYSDHDPVKPAAKVIVGHYKTTEIVDRSSPVALTQLEGIQAIDSPGGLTRIPPGKKFMTMQEIIRTVGSKINSSSNP